MQRKYIPHIIDQHAEEAAFLWLLRNSAVSAPHYDLEALADLDERVEAHLDGLRIAGDYGWEICKANLDFKENGELFAATVLALESQSAEKLKTVYAVLAENPELQSGFVSALGWIEPKFLQGKVSGFLASKEPFWRKIGIAACAVQRVDPKDYLKQGIKDEDADLCCQSLKTAGELGRTDLMGDMHKAMASKNLDIKFWSAWAAVLCGDRQQALNTLLLIVKQGGADEYSNVSEAMELLFRIMALGESKDLLADLKEQSRLRHVIKAIGIRGEIDFIPWLIEQMDVPELSRVAGESFTTITGKDLAYDDLDKDKPKGFESGPTENPEDDDVELDADEDLPWPNPEAIQLWWSTNKSNFTIGTRYLNGMPISKETCQTVLKEGTQRQRKAAALELALMDANTVLFETSAMGKRQQNIL